jgi:hypothetical protein
VIFERKSKKYSRKTYVGNNCCLITPKAPHNSHWESSIGEGRYVIKGESSILDDPPI